MPFSRKLLSPGEEIVLEAHPNWSVLIRRVTLAVVVIAGCIAVVVSWSSAPFWIGYALLAVGLLALAGVLAKVVAWRSTTIVITNVRVVYRTGVLRRFGREIPLGRVQDVTYRQSIVERMLGAGSLTIESAGQSGQEPFPDIAHPAMVQSLINSLMAGQWGQQPGPVMRPEGGGGGYAGASGSAAAAAQARPRDAQGYAPPPAGPAETQGYGQPADTQGYGRPAGGYGYGQPAETQGYGQPAGGYGAPPDYSEPTAQFERHQGPGRAGASPSRALRSSCRSRCFHRCSGRRRAPGTCGTGGAPDQVGRRTERVSVREHRRAHAVVERGAREAERAESSRRHYRCRARGQTPGAARRPLGALAASRRPSPYGEPGGRHAGRHNEAAARAAPRGAGLTRHHRAASIRPMPTASSNGLSIYFETFGDLKAPPVLLIAGLGMQMVDWPPQWIDRLVGAGYFVISFDNRDIGLSTHLSSSPPPDLGAFLGGGKPNIAYYLGDMAGDAVAVLDTLQIETAHVIGVSMGGMIAQQVAIDNPERLRSLCSIMSNTGAAGVGQPTPAVLVQLLVPPPPTREEAIDRSIAISKLIGSPGLPQDEEVMRVAAAQSYDRSHDPDGVARQLGAIVASPDRTEGLGTVKVPTVVIHGTADPLVQPDGGKATAAAIPGARLVNIEGMGHDLPPELWDEILEAIVANMRKADAERAQLTVS